MNEKVLLSVGATFSKSVGKDLQRELDIISKQLKLTVKNVDLAGKKITSSSDSTSDKIVKSNQKQIDSIDKLIGRYKTQKITYEQLQEYGRKIAESESFKNKTYEKQAKLYKTLETASKERHRVLAEEKKINDQLIVQSKKQTEQAKKQIDVFRKRNQEIFKMYTTGSSNLPTQKTSAFNLTAEEMKARNQQFNDWFSPVSSKSAKESASVFDELFQKSEKATVGLSKIEKQTLKLNKAFKTGSMETRGYFANLALIGKKFADWMIISTLVFAPLHAFQKGLDTLKEIDTQLVDIAKVTNLTKEEMKDLADEATRVGVALGRGASEYLGAVAEFSRAGYGENAKSLAEVSLLLQNVGDVSGETANEMLLAVDAAYKLGGSQEELTSVVDKLNKVSNQNPTSILKMAEGIKVTASIMQQSGVSIDDFIALVGTATSVTQRSGSEMARGLRTVLLRLQGVTDAELDVTEDSISKAEEVLNKYGVAVRDSVNTLRAPMEVFRELSEKFRTDLKDNEVAQSEIIQRLAGQKQANVFASIINNWDMVEKQIGEALDSTGSAMKENEIFMDSWRAKSNQLSAAVTEFWEKSLDTDMIKWFIDAMRSIVEFTTEWGGLLPIVIGLLAGGLTAAIMAVNAGVTILNVKLSYTNIMLAGIPAAVGLITAAISGWIIKTRDIKDVNDELNDTLEVQTRNYKELNKAREDTVDLANEQKRKSMGEIELARMLTNELSILSDKTNKTSYEKEQMYKVANKINKLIPDLNISIDKETGKLNTQIGTIREAINAYRELVLVKAAEKSAEGAGERLFESRLNIDKNKKEREELMKKVRPYVGDDLSVVAKTVQSPNAPMVQAGAKPIPENILKSILKIKELDKVINENLLVAYQADRDIKTAFNLSEEYTKKFPKLKTESYMPPGGDSTGGISTPTQINPEKYMLDLKGRTNDLRQAVDMATIAIEENNAKQQDNNLTTSQRIDLLKEEVKLIEGKNIAVANLANEEKKIIAETRSKLAEKGIQFNADGTMSGASYDKISSQKQQELMAVRQSLADQKNLGKSKDTELYKQLSIQEDQLKMDLDNLKSWADDYDNTLKDHYKNTIEQLRNTGTINQKIAAINDAKYDLILEGGARSRTRIGRLERDLEGVSGTDYDAQIRILSKIQKLKTREASRLKKSSMAGMPQEIRSKNLDSIRQYEEDVNKITVSITEKRVKKLETIFNDFKDSLSPLGDELVDLDSQLELVGGDEFGKQIDITNQKIKVSEEITSQLKNELNKLNRTKVKTKDEENELGEQISEVNTLIKEQEYDTAKLIATSKQLAETLEKEAKELGERYIEDIAQKLIDGIDEEKDKRKKALDEFKESQNEKIKLIEQELEATADQNELIDQQAERTKRLMEIRKQEEKLSNIKNERNVRMLTSSGWEWVANPKDVRDATEELESLRMDLNEWEINNVRQQAADKKSIAIEILKQEIEEKESQYEKDVMAFENSQDKITEALNNAKDNQSKSIDEIMVKWDEMGANVETQIDIVKTALIGLDSALAGLKNLNASAVTGVLDSTIESINNKTKNIKETIAERKLNMTLNDTGGNFKSGSIAVNLSGNDEQVLSPEQTKSWRKLVDNLPIVTTMFDNIMSSLKYPNSSPLLAGAGFGGETYTINVDKVVTDDVDDFVSQMKNLTRLTNRE